MKSPPAFQFYAADFDTATSTWELDEVGLYIRLLSYQWINGKLPNDPRKLSKIARISPKKFSNLFQIVSKKFISDGNGNIFNLRLEKVRQEQTKYRESQSKHGKRGADKRWGRL
jgi:uncharacterized protein YdaU (DUF1376 family)